MSRLISFRVAVCAAVCLLSIGNASAALFDRGGGLIYDSDQNLTWLQDANYAMTSGYSGQNGGGNMFWSDAVTWADQLVYGGYSDWRLPTSDTCTGFTCTNSEMGHLFYVELVGAENINAAWYAAGGIDAYSPIDGLSGSRRNNPALSPFFNTENAQYWSGTTDVADPTRAMVFYVYGVGGQASYNKVSVNAPAWAVRDGDVVAAIPEPETYAMMLTGLALLGWVGRRKNLKERVAV